MRFLLVLAAAIGCTNDSPGDCPPIADAVADSCGPVPSFPGAVAAFDADTVTMSRTTYDALITWHDDVNTWAGCVASL